MMQISLKTCLIGVALIALGFGLFLPYFQAWNRYEAGVLIRVEDDPELFIQQLKSPSFLNRALSRCPNAPLPGAPGFEDLIAIVQRRLQVKVRSRADHLVQASLELDSAADAQAILNTLAANSASPTARLLGPAYLTRINFRSDWVHQCLLVFLFGLLIGFLFGPLALAVSRGFGPMGARRRSARAVPNPR